MKRSILSVLLSGTIALAAFPAHALAHQNVLLIIADDLGVDVLDIDHATNTIRVTTETDNAGTRQSFDLPNLSKLLAKGLYFTNAWSTPVCSPTRATLYTGLQPWKTGVGYPKGNYILEDTLPEATPGTTIHTKTLANFICDGNGPRTCGLFGKWHLGGENYDVDPEGNFTYTPLNRGWDYYAGNLGSHLHGGDTYSEWTKFTSKPTKDGYFVERDNLRTEKYATEDVVAEAKTWIAAQTGTWFATLAFNAPHSPFHVPPEDTYASNTNIPQSPQHPYKDNGEYNAMDQSLDYYIGKLWDPRYVRNITDHLTNTLIIFLGDNGTPEEVANVSPAKNSVYLGGIHVPLIIADGAKVVNPRMAPTYLAPSVLGKTQDNPVNVADLFRTIIARTGGTLPKRPIPGLPPTTPFGAHSWDLSGYLQDRVPNDRRVFNFTQKYKSNGAAWATVSGNVTHNNVERTYKLNYQDGSWELFDLDANPGEDTAQNLYDDPNYISPRQDLCDELSKHQMTDTAGDHFPSCS